MRPFFHLGTCFFTFALRKSCLSSLSLSLLGTSEWEIKKEGKRDKRNESKKDEEKSSKMADENHDLNGKYSKLISNIYI